MNATRSSIRAVAIVLGGLLLQVGAASAQHGGGGHYAGGSHYGGGGHYGGYYGGHYYPRFYLYGGLYGYYGYPYHPYGSYGYGGYGYGGYEYDDTAAVRLLVEPDEARVFVDGYYAGIADDFNGASQRLRLPPGRHEIVLKLEGYRAHRIEVYAPVGQTLKVHYRMAKGTGEDVAEDLTPDGYPDDARGRGDRHGALSGPGPDRDRGDVSRGERDERVGHGGGELRLSVRPGDAVIYLDGEFRGPGRQVRRLELPPGRHSIEVVRPGFQTFERTVDVEQNRPVDIDVKLRPAGS